MIGKLFSLGLIFFPLLGEENNSDFIALKDSLRAFERKQVVFVLLGEKNINSLEERALLDNPALEEIIAYFPVLHSGAKNENFEKREIFYFYSFLEYKGELEELRKIGAKIDESESLTDDEEEYLKTYYNLLLVNLWVKLKNQQKRPPDEEVLSLLKKTSYPSSKSSLSKKHLSEYFALYAGLSAALNKVKKNFFADLIDSVSYDFESEIFLLKAINLDGNNYRAILQFVLKGISLRSDNYFFIYKVISQLNKVLEQEETDKERLFVVNVILANIYYLRNDLKNSWKYIQSSKKLFPQNEISRILEENFKNREKKLINL